MICHRVDDKGVVRIGASGVTLDLIVEYAKVRETFGRKIGSWQAVRHPCADMAVRVEAARCQLFYAATALKEGSPDAPLQVDAAKLLAVRAAQVLVLLPDGAVVTNRIGRHALPVDYVPTDWATVVQRRASREPLDRSLAIVAAAALGHVDVEMVAVVLVGFRSAVDAEVGSAVHAIIEARLLGTDAPPCWS